MNSVAAVIILYNPDKSIIANLESCRKQVDKLFVVDNSEGLEETRIKIETGPDIEIFSHNENLGVATALNIAAKQALKDEFDYLLTLDQDTLIPEDLVSKLLFTIQSDKMAAIAAPFYSNINYDLKPLQKDLSLPLVVPTSANLLNLIAFREVGNFNDNLFIDYVDFDFCMRLKLMGYKILQNNSIVVKHSVGNLVKDNFLGFKFYTTNHPPLRLYYRTRNRFYLRKTYKSYFPDFFRKDLVNLLKQLVKMILVEKNKFQKLKMIVLGYRHYKTGQLGKLNS
ncbi:MAG: glycosyltransferase family 2 protein [Ignavibacteria bacterium]|nr:glycosyltransferase family 2 protein [Ignavibacteria bacterium]